MINSNQPLLNTMNLYKLKLLTNNLTDFSKIDLLNISKSLVPYLPQEQKNQWFKFKANKIQGHKYDYSKVVYVNTNTKVEIICPEHGSFYQTPEKHLYGQNCPKCAYKINGNRNRKTTEQFVQEANQIHNNKYDYSKVVYVNAFSKLEIICPEHGSFYQSSNGHLTGGGCPLCYKENNGNKIRKSPQQFTVEAIQVHGNKYDYSKLIYTNANKKVTIICPEHGIFYQTPSKHLSGQGCPKCNSSKGETTIRVILSTTGINHTEQHNFNKHPNLKSKSSYLTFDFYLPNHNLCIEYDGIQHFEEIKHFGCGLQITQERDNIKNEFCLDNNIRLIRIPYWVNITKQLILSYLSKNFTIISITEKV